ncbi:MAG: hypothetical protein U9Q17_01795 [Chloroflexota bacterium]|nr:hypothetical protein [Chloroflexota bacterium]
MKIYDYYIISLTSLLLVTTVVMAALDESRPDLYFTVYLIETLALNELFVYLNPRARRSLNAVNYVLFAGFLAIVASKVAVILWNFDTMAMLYRLVQNLPWK